jgi:hypothetical protein
MQPEPAQQQAHPPIDPQLRVREEPFSFNQALEESQLLPSSYPLEGIEGELTTFDADIWLDNIFNGEDSEQIAGVVDVEPSPLTSMATDPQTTREKIFKGCKCPSHQDIYNDWPTQDAELTIRHVHENMHVLRQ